MKKLLLWDVDGTLIWGGGGGERSLAKAMKEAFSIDAELEVVDYWGRTDKKIGQMLMDYYGVTQTQENLHGFIEAYLAHLVEQMPLGDTKTHPGIVDILEAASEREDIFQGLLTGNMVSGAEIKLSHFELWHYFEFGGFADDSAIRNEIAPFALNAASTLARKQSQWQQGLIPLRI